MHLLSALTMTSYCNDDRQRIKVGVAERVFVNAGWVAGPLVLFMFAWITWYCSALLIDCYRYPDTDGEMRNYTYIMAVKRYLGEFLSNV